MSGFASALFRVLPRSERLRRIRATHRIDLTTDESDSKSRVPWHRRLWWTGIDRKARDRMVELDNALTDLHSEAGDVFVEALEAIQDSRGTISADDVERALRGAMDAVLDRGEDVFRSKHRDIWDHARDHALNRAGISPTMAATNRLMRFSRTRLAEDSGERISDSFRDSMTRVKSLPDDVIENLRERLMKHPLEGTTTREVIRSVIGDLIDQIDPEGVLSPQDLRAAVREIWDRTRSDLQRVVRTESINAYAKAQLQEWYEQGIRQVTRHSINDPKTCPKCQALSRPGYNVYEISALLALEHPVTEDPANPGSFLTHPNCRCWFRPVLEDVWSRIEDMERSLFVDMEGDSVSVSDVPLDSQEQVAEVVKDWNQTAPESQADFVFVPSVSQEDTWQDARREELEKEDPKTAEERLAEEIKSDDVVEWTDPESGLTLISDEARNADYTTKPFARRQAEIRWDTSPGVRDWWEERFKEKMAETTLTLENDGVEIIGGLPFLNQAAGESPRSYFIEAYAAYMVEPTLLKALDRPAYETLRDRLFGGREYLERGGLN